MIFSVHQITGPESGVNPLAPASESQLFTQYDWYWLGVLGLRMINVCDNNTRDPMSLQHGIFSDIHHWIPFSVRNVYEMQMQHRKKGHVSPSWGKIFAELLWQHCSTEWTQLEDLTPSGSGYKIRNNFSNTTLTIHSSQRISSIIIK